jgi:hypothetical protein
MYVVFCLRVVTWKEPVNNKQHQHPTTTAATTTGMSDGLTRLKPHWQVFSFSFFLLRVYANVNFVNGIYKINTNRLRLQNRDGNGNHQTRQLERLNDNAATATGTIWTTTTGSTTTKTAATTTTPGVRDASDASHSTP